jgi:NAD-dependent SIR2 family protein deacetylase
MQVSEIAEKLVRQKQSGQSTILFLGAGASVTANIPTTRGIVQYINESSEFDHIENPGSQNYFDIMGQLEPGERKKLLSHFINKAKINETHFIAGQLMRLGYIDCIITTNFDPLIENSTNLFHTNYHTIDVVNNVSLTGHSVTFPSIIYLHGKYRNV